MDIAMSYFKIGKSIVEPTYKLFVHKNNQFSNLFSGEAASLD